MEKVLPKRMLLFGPGYGHNTEGVLNNCFSDYSLFEVVFLGFQYDESLKQKFPYIKHVPSKFEISKKHPWRSLKSIFWLYKQVRCTGHYDIIYSLGTGGLMGALIFWFARKNTKKAFEIWSMHIIDRAKSAKNIFAKMDRYVLKKSDFVCQYWWGARERFLNAFPEYEHKFLLYQHFNSDIYFENVKHIPESTFVRNFLAKIPQNQIMCFWPRSFIPSNNHPLLIDSLGIIKKRNPQILENFKLYLWGGNVEREERVREIKDAINKNRLGNYVEIVEHPFVPQNDIFAIEERSDFFVQIANDDILSTFIMEMICSGKPFVLSNLRTFQFLNKVYDLNIDLVNNDSLEIASRVETILSDLHISRKAPDYSRRDKCKLLFSKSNVALPSQILYDAL